MRLAASAAVGDARIEWADRQMSVLRTVRERFARERPLRGWRVAACLHVTSETANLVRAAAAGGAEVVLCASNPLSTQDEVAAAIAARHGVKVFGDRGEDRRTYYRHLDAAIRSRPHLVLDDGGDLIALLHERGRAAHADVVGATEDTTTGVTRLLARERAGGLAFPVIAVNAAQTKLRFGNRLGTGQSALDGVIRATNWLIAGRVVVVAGYGWCGRGVAERARGLGARVVVTEVDPLRALAAVFDGFQVLPMARAAGVGDIFVTATGTMAVVRREHLERMKDGAALANTGHFDVEVDVRAVAALAVSRRRVREHVEEFVLGDGRRLYLLAEGRLVNLAAAEGHPASLMDMTFANQALALEYVARNASALEARVYPVPEEIDRTVAALKLEASGVSIDESPSQTASRPTPPLQYAS